MKFTLQLVLSVYFLAPGVCCAHNNFVPVGAVNGRLVKGSVFIGGLTSEPMGLFADNPAFEVESPLLGIPAGTQLEIDVLSELVYWDGDKFAETDATLTIESPTALAEVVASAGSQAVLGLPWGTYPDTQESWHLDGSYVLNTPSGEYPLGIYGVTARLNSPSFLPSETFSLAFIHDEGNVLDAAQETAGLLALRRLAEAPQPGDYHLDETVDSDDYLRWSHDFGQVLEASSTGADGSGDGTVNLADFTVWRDNLTPLPSGLNAGDRAVPELPTAATFSIVFLLAMPMAVYAGRKGKTG